MMIWFALDARRRVVACTLGLWSVGLRRLPEVWYIEIEEDAKEGMELRSGVPRYCSALIEHDLRSGSDQIDVHTRFSTTWPKSWRLVSPSEVSWLLFTSFTTILHLLC